MSASPKKKTKGKGSKKGSKKKGSAKKTKKAAAPDEFDGLDLKQLSDVRPQLQAARDEVMKHRSYYQLQRDQLQACYDITREEKLKTEAHVRNIESQMERMQDTHRDDIRIYLQKVIHLEYEHSNNVDAVNRAAEKQRESEQQAHERKKAELKQQKLVLKADIREQEAAYETEIAQLKEVERKELHKLRESFERNHHELQAKYEARLKQLKDDLELRRKMEVHEIEERKNRHINDLIANHDKAFAEIKAYYNNITQDNLTLIKTLNDDIEELKLARVENERMMEAIEKENATLSNPLRKAEAEVERLRAQLGNFDKDKESLKHAKARLAVLDDQYKQMLS